ncbi:MULTISPECIES: lysylphosphatidylglycerol synthase domain-containing protein [unclassified Leptolyngbya]|uniref:lysylphosphatidylglycerol synthase domain-containing protein n=1 Tax=unclassified Leptolyngbya TaxID=2650499 RepID=UPI00168733C9|nr:MULTISPECIES: lysylphosphatidylglycerol synthase domain-containing protein [unclassified Leptolyngbya]MBD1912553.1 UPF0104 family protein [Leptolyngbya sp. FACHB-8]MBD2154906.1 UPF0104 family protein [Leptolyngbya sp. FACHB-16]
MHSWRQRFQHYAHWFPVILGFGLFGISLWAIRQQLRQHTPEEIWSSVQAIPIGLVGVAIALTLLNYWTLTGYDTLAAIYIRQPLPYRKTALAAVTSYAISNTIGLALLSGSAIRYRFYAAWQIPATKIAQIIAFCNISFWLGLFSVGGILFVIEPIEIPALLDLPVSSVHPIGVLFLIVITAYLIWSVISARSLQIAGWTIPHLPIQLSLAQIVITSLDWALAAAVLYTLLPSASPLSYPGFFGIYLLAQLAGIISNVPGGLGVFESVMLALISPPVATNELFSALLAYRAIYYFLPFSVAILMLGAYELRQRYRHHFRSK